MPESFPKNHRLLTQDEFGLVLNKNTGRIRQNSILILFKNNTHPHSRIGLAIAKRLLKKASQRKRIKRLVRESFRKKSDELKCLDIVVLGRDGIATQDNQQITECLDKIWEKLQAKCKS